MRMKENAASEGLRHHSQAEGETQAIERSSLGRDQLRGSRETEQRSTPTPSTWTLFEEPYWLDCVAPGAWKAVEITRDGRVVARLPYVVKKRYGTTALTLPDLTPWLGPWMAPSDGKYNNQLGAQHQLLRELVGQLPKATRVLIGCAPEYTNLHALHSLGWSLGVKYTYRTACCSNLDLIWKGLSKTTRNRIRHARKKVEIVTGPDQLPNLIDCLLKSFARQDVGQKFPPLAALIERIDSGLGSRDQRMITTAIDEKGRPHASSFLVFDERHVFMLVRGSDETLRTSGADSLLVWEAIRFASTRSLSFDFLGSMIPAIERFNRGFGMRQLPLYFAVKHSRLSEVALALERMIHRSQTGWAPPHS